MTATNMQYNRDRAIQKLRSFSVDDQLALLWYIYDEIGDSIEPGSPQAAGFDIAEALADRVRDCSQDQQLQMQRDIVSGADSEISRGYGSGSASTKMAFWYILAQDIDEGNVVPVPEDYELSDEADQFFGMYQNLDFEEQVGFVRNAVMLMGAAVGTKA